MSELSKQWGINEEGELQDLKWDGILYGFSSRLLLHLAENYPELKDICLKLYHKEN